MKSWEYCINQVKKPSTCYSNKIWKLSGCQLSEQWKVANLVTQFFRPWSRKSSFKTLFYFSWSSLKTCHHQITYKKVATKTKPIISYAFSHQSIHRQPFKRKKMPTQKKNVFLNNSPLNTCLTLEIFHQENKLPILFANFSISLFNWLWKLQKGTPSV